MRRRREAHGRRLRGRRSTGGQNSQDGDAHMATRWGAGPSASLPPGIGRHKRRRRCPYGNKDHGKLVGGVRICTACHAEPTEGLHNDPLWRHLPSNAGVENVWTWWQSAAKRSDSCVRDGYVPSMECLCRRRGCFFPQWTAKKEKKSFGIIITP
ncbi:unnamed protein product [Ectocarpus sp. 12 AP-2014]